MLRQLAGKDYNSRMDYTTQHIQAFFGNISHQTVKNWCKYFANWLSPTATPGKNKQRRFTDNDLAVFALAHEMLNKGKTYEDVQAALANGSRGEMPSESVDLLPSPVSGQVLALRESLAIKDHEIKQLQTALDEQRGQNRLLERQLSEALAENKALNREIGRLEGSKGSE